MTDDLVKRLRATTVWKEYADGSKVTQIRNPDGAEAADRIEALTAENERLRLHLDVALETLAEEGVCGDECITCKEARAALGDTQ